MLRMTFGDAASVLSLRSRNTELKSKMSTLSQEVSTGTVSSVRRHTKGRVAEVARIEERSKILDDYNTGIAQLEVVQDAAQASLGRIGASLQSLRDEAVLFQTSSSLSSQKAFFEKSKLVLESVVSALNISVSGESIFSGMATDSAPFDLDGLTAAVKAHVLTGSPLQPIDEKVEEFFLNTGIYEAQAYSGSSEDRSYLINDGRTANLGIRADDLEIRRALSAVMGVVVALDEATAISGTQRKDAISNSIARISSTNNFLLSVRARLGGRQEDLALQKAANTAQIEGLQMLKSEKLSVDQYAKISELREAESRLDTVYAMTARMSRLSLLEYIK